MHLELESNICRDLRQFISKRGSLNQMYGDNGTYSTGVKREIKQVLKEIDQGKTTTKLNEMSMERKFMVSPHQSHG